MKKRFSALFCGLALLILCAVPSAPALEGEAQRAADTLASLGLVQGYGTDYALEAPATRVQAIVLLTRLSGEDTANFGPAPFQDAPAWAEEALSAAAGRGWISSEETAFRPEETVELDDFCAWMLRMLGYRDRRGDFSPASAAVFARHIGLLARDYEGPLKRGDLFQILRDALPFSYKDGGSVIAHLVDRGVCTQALANALGLLQQELTARQAADRYMAAVFCLRTYEDQEKYAEDKARGDASGFFITSDGIAVTNYHSIDRAALATVTLVTGEIYEVERVLYYHREMDLAVLKISRTSVEGETTSAFAHLDLAEGDDLRVGDAVYAIGSPLGLGLAVSSGIVSAVGREVENYTLPCIMNTADISQGSSGGALMNVYGRVVGITAGAYAYGNNMYLAVPVSAVQSAEISKTGKTLAQVLREVTETEQIEG